MTESANSLVRPGARRRINIKTLSIVDAARDNGLSIVSTMDRAAKNTGLYPNPYGQKLKNILLGKLSSLIQRLKSWI